MIIISSKAEIHAPLFECDTWVSPNIKTQAATSCAKHENVQAEAATEKTEATTDCAKHGNVVTEAATGKAEAATGCAKHRNVVTEAATGKT
ncbi:hypothetical protein [Fortiea contorta]|uniref:hypothetical protein n=1 Tax=Fortiea contorta TaxID=1892405 RepID=UPI000379E372|nr:hypothetical protein [Fortiea contorta]